MPEFRMPRMPKVVAPKSMSPEDVLSAVVETQHDAYNALVKEPLSSAGVTPPPEVPTPEMLLQQMTAGMKPPTGFLGTPPFGGAGGGSPIGRAGGGSPKPSGGGSITETGGSTKGSASPTGGEKTSSGKGLGKVY